MCISLELHKRDIREVTQWFSMYAILFRILRVRMLALVSFGNSTMSPKNYLFSAAFPLAVRAEQLRNRKRVSEEEFYT